METQSDKINCPTILSSTMPIEKAKHIIRQVIDVSFRQHGIGEHTNAAFPMNYSLEEFCIAARILNAHQKAMGKNSRNGKTLTFQLEMDDRGIAAQYALAHFHNSPHKLLEALGYMLDGSDDDEDDDE